MYLWYGIITKQHHFTSLPFLFLKIEKFYQSNCYLVGIQIQIMCSYTQSQHTGPNLISCYRSWFMFSLCNWVFFCSWTVQIQLFSRILISGIKIISLFYQFSRLHFMYKINWRIFTDKKWSIPISITGISKSFDSLYFISKCSHYDCTSIFLFKSLVLFPDAYQKFSSGSSFMCRGFS